MAKTSIEWTDFSINPIRARWKIGMDPNYLSSRLPYHSGHYCEKISPGCKNCYASRLQPRFGLPTFSEAIAQRDDIEVYLDESKLQQVLRRKKPTKYFWCDMSDMFGSWVPDEWTNKCFATMALTPQHTHQVLTKRAERMQAYFAPGRYRDCQVADQAKIIHTSVSPFKLPSEAVFDARRVARGEPWLIDTWPLSNVWLGVSAENQDTFDERVPLLMDTPAAVRFISYEPALGPVDFSLWRPVETIGGVEFERWIDWIIAGGESGPGARPSIPEWFRSLRDQCQAAGVPYFFKQWGEWAPAPNRTGLCMERIGKKAAGRLLDGRTWDQFPEVRR